MKLRYQSNSLQTKRWLLGGALIFLVTLVPLLLPLGNRLAAWGYDLPFLFRSNISVSNVVVLIEDRASLDSLGETAFPPSRTVHARLLDELTEQTASVVAFDISFRASKPDEDEKFASAIRRHGHVILGGVVETTTGQVGDSAGTRIVEVKPPAPALQAAASGWGLLVLGSLDENLSVRRIISEWKGIPTLPLLVARSVQTNKGAVVEDSFANERWINFYGPSPAFDQVTLGEVLGLGGRTLPPGFLRGKIVFVGFDSAVTPAVGRRDLFATPYTVAGRDFTPGVEIMANICSNLIEGYWLRRIPDAGQCALSLAFGVVTLVLFVISGKRWFWLASAVMLFLSLAIPLLLQWHFRWWYNWIPITTVQLPLMALLFALHPRMPVVAFISYRRRGGDAFAMALHNALRLKTQESLLDVNEIGSGEFPQQIYGMIDRVPNVLVVLSRNALDDRVNDPEDWLRKEVGYAFSKGKNVIPIMLDGFDFNESISLPQEMASLPKLQAVLHSHDKWEATLQKIQSYMRVS